MERKDAAPQMKNKQWALLLRIGLLVIAAGYAAALFKTVLFPDGFASGVRQIQWIPFRFVYDFFASQTSLSVQFRNVLCDLAAFVPLGVLLPVFFRGLRFRKTVLVGAAASIAFELVQLITGCGVTDVDDLILNTLGCAAGAALYFFVFLRRRKRRRAAYSSLIFLAAFGALGLLSLWLFAPGAQSTQIVYENQAALCGEERYAYDVGASCTGIESGWVHLRPGGGVMIREVAEYREWGDGSSTLVQVNRLFED